MCQAYESNCTTDETVVASQETSKGSRRVHQDGSVTLNGTLTQDSSYWSVLSYEELQALAKNARRVRQISGKTRNKAEDLAREHGEPLCPKDLARRLRNIMRYLTN